MVRSDFGFQELEGSRLEKWRADMLEEQVKIRQALEQLVSSSLGEGLAHLELPGLGEEQVTYHIIVKRIDGGGNRWLLSIGMVPLTVI